MTSKVNTWEELPEGEWLPTDEHGRHWYLDNKGNHWHSDDDGYRIYVVDKWLVEIRRLRGFDFNNEHT